MSTHTNDSKSAPTTPGGSKKRARFDDNNLEEYHFLRRTSTAPSTLERLDLPPSLLSNDHDNDDYLREPDWSST